MKKILPLLAGLIFMTGCTFTISTDTPQKTNNTTAVTTPAGSQRIITMSKYQVNQESINSNGKVVGFTLELVRPDGSKTTLPTAVQNKLTGDGSLLENFDFPVDPQNTDLIYISTARSLNDSSNDVQNKIFTLNTKTNELVQVYSQKATDGTIREIVGREGTQLVVLNQGFDNSPGPCSSMWVDYQDNFTSIDTKDIAAGFKPYVVPPEKIAEGKKEAQSCAEDI